MYNNPTLQCLPSFFLNKFDIEIILSSDFVSCFVWLYDLRIQKNDYVISLSTFLRYKGKHSSNSTRTLSRLWLWLCSVLQFLDGSHIHGLLATKFKMPNSEFTERFFLFFLQPHKTVIKIYEHIVSSDVVTYQDKLTSVKHLRLIELLDDNGTASTRLSLWY